MLQFTKHFNHFVEFYAISGRFKLYVIHCEVKTIAIHILDLFTAPHYEFGTPYFTQ